MKKLVIVFAVLSMFAAAACAEFLRVGLNVDYTTIGMADVNKELGKITGATKFGSGVLGTLDVGISVFPVPTILVGPKAGYLYCFPAKYEFTDILSNKYVTTSNLALIPLELGAAVSIGIPGVPISVIAGVWGGYGLAYQVDTTQVTIAGNTGNFIMPYNGGGFVGEATAIVNFNIFPFISLNLNGGYRLANIPNMKSPADVKYTINGTEYTAPSATLKDSDGKDLKYDFSGFNVGGGLSIGF